MINNIITKKINNYCKEHDTKIIYVDGITCSGKSYFSDLLFKYLNKKFKNIYLIRKDFFLLSRNKRIKMLPLLKNKINKNQNTIHYDQKKIKKVIQAINNNKKIVMTGLYNRSSGKNDKKIVFNFKNVNIIIFEGLYSLNDFHNNFKSSLKFLIIENIYSSLIRKIKRIRDKKISIENVLLEFTQLHLPSFLIYLHKFEFDICIEVNKNEFIKSNFNKEKQIALIKLFQKKHL